MSKPLQLRALTDRLVGLAAQIETLVSQAPEVTVVRDETEEGSVRVLCPACGDVPSEWGELDGAWRQNAGEGGGSGVTFYQGDAEFVTLAFYCADCEQVAQFPPTLNVAWV